MTKKILPIYVRCIDNQAYVGYQNQPAANYSLARLVVGQIYKVALPKTNDGDLLRIIDESGEDFLFPKRYFVPLNITDRTEASSKTVSTHLPEWLQGVLHAEALAANKPVSALLREWIEERLDLAEA